ncbi:uncharacterized protein LOC115899235 isoform X1 [Rhinopithecus roxellana]|uniref:uncharacterized protein LOC115899235 isoform X1 n=1 Tax=Rhinopithecus roxellana TaxID=61622 RepID=UPI0012379A3D|nr:uncharacterized protein LOC115899235 isoform X1 [Rhinopithecus roxellana]
MPWASHWVPVLCFIPRYQKGGIWMSGATFNPEKARVPKQQEDVQVAARVGRSCRLGQLCRPPQGPGAQKTAATEFTVSAGPVFPAVLSWACGAASGGAPVAPPFPGSPASRRDLAPASERQRSGRGCDGKGLPLSGRL